MMNNLHRLLNLMEHLRDPEQGCPWDRQQTFNTILPYTIEEVYEVADAIDKQDYTQLQDELGDLLLQIVYYAQMAKEQDLFDFEDIAQCIGDKLIRRHPHIFNKSQQPKETSWEKIKQVERYEKSKRQSILDDIPLALPQLLSANKIQQRVASVGFDWHEIKDVFNKVKEELDELDEVITATQQKDRVEEELGDLLFSIVNLSRHLKINAEDALRKSNKKFTLRFKYVEKHLASRGKDLKDCTAEEMELAWGKAKTKLV